MRSHSSTSSSTSSSLDVPSDVQLVEQVGRGTYGSVFAAHFQGRLAAVKAIPFEAGPDGRSLAADIQKEIRMLSKCDSPHVVKYYGCLSKARTLWIAMELCDGSAGVSLWWRATPDVARCARSP